jgi:hypothetical protein
MTQLFCYYFSDVVQELITSGNVIDAIYIAYEAGLLERFPPVPLLNAYIKESSEKAQAVLSSRRRSSSAVVRLYSTLILINLSSNCLNHHQFGHMPFSV